MFDKIWGRLSRGGSKLEEIPSDSDKNKEIAFQTAPKGRVNTNAAQNNNVFDTLL